MATATSTGPLIFYPAYTFSSSPTYFAWVKLTAHDIHHVLRSRPRFTALTANSKTELLFYLNHPIQFVHVTGVVVAYEDYYDKFWSFTIDDGSGEVVECVCWKPEKEQVKDDDSQSEKVDVEPKKKEVGHMEREEIIKMFDIGTVVQVKGTISTFREVRQLNIERLSVVSSTNYEVLVIAARTKFLEEVLMKPWVVSPNRQKQLLKEAQGEKQKVKQKQSERTVRLKERARKLEERDKRHAEKIAKKYEAEEDRRKKDAEEAKQAAIDMEESRSRRVVRDEFADLAY
jgi:Telomere regulation protein Stn1